MGTAKLGTDSGLKGGTAVVDTNTRVYGTDNIFVVDASIWPGMPSTNPSGLIVVAAERAAELIQKLPLNVALTKVSSEHLLSSLEIDSNYLPRELSVVERIILEVGSARIHMFARLSRLRSPLLVYPSFGFKLDLC